VWNTVEKHKKHAFTSIIHGKVKHEETLATSSFAGTYLVVLGLTEAQMVCDYILGKGNRQAFIEHFAKACSPGFDPDRDLSRGWRGQSDHHAQERNGGNRPDVRAHHAATPWPGRTERALLAFNTICDATQERQDAMFSLVDEPLDLMVVIGGYNSSNTTHLQEIAISRASAPFTSIRRSGSVLATRLSTCPWAAILNRSPPFLPAGPLRVGITSGASTPDRVVEDVIRHLMDLCDN